MAAAATVALSRSHLIVETGGAFRLVLQMQQLSLAIDSILQIAQFECGEYDWDFVFRSF